MTTEVEHLFDRGMRWDTQRLQPAEEAGAGTENGTLPGMESLAGLPGLLGAIRTVRTPEFAGITFHEVMAKSALNRVPDAASVPFRWTINPYRGCSHACRYCFARKTHTYLDLDAGADFDRELIVKVNVADVLGRELRRPDWNREHVALGTNTDPYQRAEGRYQLMPGIITALHRSATPFSVLTKGTLLLRDLPLLRAAAADLDVSANVSVGSVDPSVWREIEPGTPAPLRRLDACRRLTDAGISCGVLMAPVLPGLSDSGEQIEATVQAAAAAGARHISAIVLHLRPGAREWYLAYIERRRPDLMPLYQELYPGRQAYAPRWYREQVGAMVRRYAHEAGLSTGENRRADRTNPRAASPEQRGAAPVEQLSLI